MAGVRKRRARRREALVHSHFERVSRDLLEQHPNIVRDVIGKNAGVYALYRRNKLYYIGLATKLSWRVKTHIKDRHGDSWDRFSIYLTIKDEHLREIESLLLRIARPPGNKVRGKFTGSKDLQRRIRAAIREKQKNEVSSLFERYRRPTPPVESAKPDDELVRLLPQGARLKGTNKGKIYKAIARRDGTVRYDGRSYSSLSQAARAAVGRPINGWWFWKIERGKGTWMRLTKIRETGTPVFSR